MDAMSHWSDIFLACSSRVNIQEPASYFTVMIILSVSRIELPSFQIPTAMLDSKSLNMSMLKVMISYKIAHIFIRNLSDLTLQKCMMLGGLQ